MKKKSFIVAVCALVVITFACSDKVPLGNFDPSTSGGPPNLPLVEGGGGGGGGDADLRLLACIGTDCPAGFASCLSGDIGAAPYKCGTDLSTDIDNCGACGNKCLTYVPLHMISGCVNGACELQCHSPPDPRFPVDWRNCNKKIDDGCETDVLTNSANCGVCGNACKNGDPCIDGKCGCPEGKIPCSGVCIDPLTDDTNCGRCYVNCFDVTVPGQCEPPPPNSHYGCKEGQCGHIKCNGRSADCNNDIPVELCRSDGCEVEDLATDPDNCGTCGLECNAGESCIGEPGTIPYCGIPCAKYNKTLCKTAGHDSCHDLLSDVRACGSCGNECPRAGPNQVRACKKGACAYECLEGFADCNDDPSDGCEADLRVHPKHCGACDNRCNIEVGQPCVEGKCLLVDCNSPGAR